MVIFEGNEYFYRWEPDSENIYVYDSNQCKIGTTKITGFDKEPETIKKLIVLAFIEAIVKKQRAKNLLKDLL